MPNKKDKEEAMQKKKQQTSTKENAAPEHTIKQRFDEVLKRIREIGKKYKIPES